MNDHELHERALAMRCPICGSDAGVSCKNGSRFIASLHAERLAAAQGLAWKANTQDHWRREFQQRRADPKLRVRRVDDDADADAA